MGASDLRLCQLAVLECPLSPQPSPNHRTCSSIFLTTTTGATDESCLDVRRRAGSETSRIFSDGAFGKPEECQHVLCVAKSSSVVAYIGSRLLSYRTQQCHASLCTRCLLKALVCPIRAVILCSTHGMCEAFGQLCRAIFADICAARASRRARSTRRCRCASDLHALCI